MAAPPDPRNAPRSFCPSIGILPAIHSISALGPRSHRRGTGECGPLGEHGTHEAQRDRSEADMLELGDRRWIECPDTLDHDCSPFFGALARSSSTKPRRFPE